MAEAAAVAGIEGELPGGPGDIPPGGGPLDGPVNAPLGMPGMDPFGSGPGWTTGFTNARYGASRPCNSGRYWRT